MIRNLGQVAAIYIGSSAPRNTNLIWLDNTVVPFVFRAYDGSAWSEIATHKWVRAYVDGWLVTLPPRQLADDGDYMLINSNNVNYKITVKDFVKSAVGNPLDFKGIIRVSADFPNPSTLESGDMYVIITSPAGGTVTDPYSGKTFEDSEKIVWDEVTQSWESLGKIDITVDLTTSYSETEVTIHSSAGKETTIQGATDQLAGVMLPGQYSWLQALSNGSIVPGDPSPLTPLTPAHKHNYNDIINRLVSQQGTGESTIDPMSQKATTDALNLKFDKASVLQVSGAATDKVMSQKAVTDALKTLSDDFNNKLTNYLPLAGGTMKGNIVFNNNLFLNWKDTKGSTYQVLSMKSNDEINIGNAAFPLNLYSKEDLFHKRNGESVYRIYDAYNLPDPATLSGNNVFTGNNTFQAGKFNVGPFEVTSSGSLLSNINLQEGSAWSRSLTFRANSDNTSKSIFGGYNSIDNTSAGYAYIGIGDVNYSTAQYKFYSNQFSVSNTMIIPESSFRIFTGNMTLLYYNKSNKNVQLGPSDSGMSLELRAQNLYHTKYDSASSTWKNYTIYSEYNLTNPVTYTTNAYNHATLKNKDGQYFTYIKAGTNGLLPHSKATLTSGGSGSLGTSDQSFNAAYINNLHTNKVTFGDAGPYITGSTSATQFLNAEGGVQKVATGGLYVGTSYASDALSLVPANGIYSLGAIKSSIGFTSNFRQTNLNLAKTGNDVLYISSFTVDAANSPGTDSNTGKNVNDGMFLTYFWVNDNAFQLAADIDGTGIAYRQYIPSSGNSTTGWKFLADTNWVVSKINSSTSNFLKKTGDTATGQIILDSNGIAFKANTWTNDLAPNRNYGGYLQVLDAYEAANAGGPTNYGTVLQVNSRNSHWANQLWFPGGAEASKNGLYYRHMAYNQTEYGDWIKLATTSDLGNYLPLSGGTISSSKSNPLTINSTHVSQSSIDFSRGGVNKGTVGFYESLGSFLQNVTGETLAVKSDGAYYGANINSLRKLATVTDLNNYLPLTGGTLSGNLTINAVGSTTLVINNNDTNGSETFMRVLRKGTASAAIGFKDGLGAYIYNYNSNKYLFIDNDGYARVGTTNGSTRLALITDIPSISGYLPLSGGTMSGNISFNGSTGHIVVGARETSNFVSAVSFNKGSATNSAYIGYHSTGGSDSSGALVLVPYPTSANPWAKTVGLYIAKNELLLDGKTIATTDQIPSIPSISISNSGSGNAVTSITANGHTLTVTKGATYLTSSALNGYATQSWANGQFASLSLYNTTRSYATIRTVGNEFCLGNTAATSASNQMLVNYRIPSGCTYAPASWVWRAGSSSSYATGYWGNLYMNDNLVATQSWASGQFPTKTGTGASGTWGISITGNAATATNSTQLGGTAASSYVKANDNISRLTNDSGYTTQEWVNSQNFVKSTSTKKVTDIQPVDALPATQASGVLYLVFG